MCGLLPGILQGLAGVVYGFARGFDPGGTVFDVQMDVLKLQCAGECIEIAGDAFDVGGAELPWLGEFQMFNDASIRLSCNAGLKRSFLAVLAVFGNQFGRFFGELLSAMALPAACVPLLADETVCMTLAVKALESKPSFLSQRSMVPASTRKTMPCSSRMMVTL